MASGPSRPPTQDEAGLLMDLDQALSSGNHDPTYHQLLREGTMVTKQEDTGVIDHNEDEITREIPDLSLASLVKFVRPTIVAYPKVVDDKYDADLGEVYEVEQRVRDMQKAGIVDMIRTCGTDLAQGREWTDAHAAVFGVLHKLPEDEIPRTVDDTAPGTLERIGMILSAIYSAIRDSAEEPEGTSLGRKINQTAREVPDRAADADPIADDEQVQSSESEGADISNGLLMIENRAQALAAALSSWARQHNEKQARNKRRVSSIISTLKEHNITVPSRTEEIRRGSVSQSRLSETAEPKRNRHKKPASDKTHASITKAKKLPKTKTISRQRAASNAITREPCDASQGCQRPEPPDDENYPPYIECDYQRRKGKQKNCGRWAHSRCVNMDPKDRWNCSPCEDGTQDDEDEPDKPPNAGGRNNRDDKGDDRGDERQQPGRKAKKQMDREDMKRHKANKQSESKRKDTTSTKANKSRKRKATFDPSSDFESDHEQSDESSSPKQKRPKTYHEAAGRAGMKNTIIDGVYKLAVQSTNSRTDRPAGGPVTGFLRNGKTGKINIGR